MKGSRSVTKDEKGLYEGLKNRVQDGVLEFYLLSTCYKPDEIRVIDNGRCK